MTKPLTSKHRDLSRLQFILASLLEMIFTDIEPHVGRQKWVCFTHIYLGIHVHTSEVLFTQGMLLWKSLLPRFFAIYQPAFFFKISLSLHQDVTSFIARRVYFHYNGSRITSPPTYIQNVWSRQKYHPKSRSGRVWKSDAQVILSSPKLTLQSEN